MKNKRPFESQRPMLRALLYMLIPVGMATLSGILVGVLKLKGNLVPLVQGIFTTFAFVIALVLVKREGGSVKSIGFQPVRNVDKWVIVAVLLPFLIYPVNFKSGLNPRVTGSYLLAYVSFAIITGLTEEAVFRGLIYRTLRYRGWAYAIFWSSFIFGAGHFANLLAGKDPTLVLVQVAYAFLIGVFYTLLVVRTRSLWLPVALHAINNSTEYLRARLPMSEEILFGLIVCGLLMLSSFLLWRSLDEEDKRAITIDGRMTG